MVKTDKVKRGRKLNREHAALLAFFFVHLKSYMKPSRKLLALGAGPSVVIHTTTYLNGCLSNLERSPANEQRQLYTLSSQDLVHVAMKSECVGTDHLHSRLDFPKERI